MGVYYYQRSLFRTEYSVSITQCRRLGQLLISLSKEGHTQIQKSVLTFRRMLKKVITNIDIL